MPNVLREHQHELMTEDGLVSLVFGTEDTDYLTLTPPSIGSLDARTGDVERYREDGTDFGEDYLGGKTMTFEIGVLTDRAANPLRAGADALGLIEHYWKMRRWRDRSGKYAVLRSMVGGRVTRCYGRPRRYEETVGRLTSKGYTPIVADFQVQDGRWYDDDAQVASVGLTPAKEGGFVAPFTFPLRSLATEVNSGSMTVGGLTETWPIVTFHGPVTAPSLNLGPYTVGLNGDIPDGMSVTVDPRPWVRKATRSDGAGYSGRLSWETPPMRTMLLDPGAYELVYSGTDATGSSYAEVRWRNAYTRP